MQYTHFLVVALSLATHVLAQIPRPCGPTTRDVTREKIGNVPYNVDIMSCVKDNMVALTFDDGPYSHTPYVLDLLQKYNAKATFFITGNNMNKGMIEDPSKDWADIIRRTHAEGHQIASHTWTHADLSEQGNGRRDIEMIYNEMALRNILGFIPTYMRPPMASCTPESGCMKHVTDLGYHVIKWDLDTKDFRNNDPELIKKSIALFDEGFTGPSHIVLSHDVQEQTAKVLVEHMLKKITAGGYKAATVGECLGDPEENWYRKADFVEECKVP